MDPRGRRRKSRAAWALVPSAVLAALILAAPAAALPDSYYYKQRAYFQAKIEGTYTAHGTQVETCDQTVGDDGRVPPASATTTVDETLRFVSTRSVRLEADRYVDNSVGAGTLNRRTPVTVTTTRTAVQTPPCNENDPAPQCGTKHMHLGISLISRDSPLRLFYDINDGRVIFPDEPFDFACRVPSVVWWGKLSVPGAPMPARKLFNRGLRRFTLHGHGGKSSGTNSGRYETHGRYDIRFAVTLVRRGR